MRISKPPILIAITLAFLAPFLAGALGVAIYIQSHNAKNSQADHRSASSPPAWSLEPVSPTAVNPANRSPAATSDGFDYNAAATAISQQGFSIEQGPAASGSQGPLRAFVVICTGSADGHCGTVDFFYVNRLIGYLPARKLGSSMILPYNARIVSEGGRYISVDLDISGPNDPLCCPRGGTINVRYYWAGHSVAVSGTQAAQAPTVSPATH